MSGQAQGLQGTDLRQAVLAGRIGPEAAVPLMLKLATALASAADQRQLRPSLKPSHIRVDAEGEPVQLEGSMLPAAPDSDEGSDERRDVFGLGVTGLFVLSGGALPADLLTRLEHFIGGLPCPAPLAALLQRACAPDPAERFASIAALRDALRALVQSSGEFAGLSGDREEACQLLLRQDPTRLSAYYDLFELYEQRGELDRAYCVARALSFLGRAEAAHTALCERFVRRGPIRPRAALDEQRWVKDLMHPGEDVLLGRVLSAITPAVIELRAQTDKALGLTPAQQVADVEGSTITLARSFGFAGRVLALPALPRLYLCPDRDGGIGHVPARPPASVCGKAVLSGIDPVDLTFIVSKHLSDCRGEHYVRTLLRDEDLAGALSVAKRVAGIDVEVSTAAPWLTQLERKVDGRARAHLQELARRFPQLAQLQDLATFQHAVELTAYRAGLLLCDDLAIAARMARADPRLARHGLTCEDVLRELLVFSVSEPYFRLRQHLGIAVA